MITPPKGWEEVKKGILKVGDRIYMYDPMGSGLVLYMPVTAGTIKERITKVLRRNACMVVRRIKGVTPVPQMAVYTCTAFNGQYSGVGTAALIVAPGVAAARKVLVARLAVIGLTLPPRAKITRVNVDKEQVVILADGDC